jgi:hypothetical protein
MLGQHTKRAIPTLALGLTLGGLTGCTETVVTEPVPVPVVDPCPVVSPPVGLYSVTGDHEVTILWIPVLPELVTEFIVYRAPTPEGPYVAIGGTRNDFFVDAGLANGYTYFYAVSAVDPCGYESQLSYEIAFDTPRPEGFDAAIYDADGENWRRSGWDFDLYRAVPWDAPSADIYLLYTTDTVLLVAADQYTDIQDAGFIGFDDMDWAPEGGWSPTGTAEVIPGHVFVVWTRDDNFAKVRAIDVGYGRLIFDWAYQVATGNPELSPRPQRLATSPVPISRSRSLEQEAGRPALQSEEG